MNAPTEVLRRGAEMTDEEILEACAEEGFTPDEAAFILESVRGGRVVSDGFPDRLS